MTAVYGFGLNVFGQLRAVEDELEGDEVWRTPQEIDAGGGDAVVVLKAATWSQTILQLQPSEAQEATHYLCIGLRPTPAGTLKDESDALSGSFRLRVERPPFQAFLGSDQLEAIIDGDGHARSTDALSWRPAQDKSEEAGAPLPPPASERKWSAAASDGLGRVIAIEDSGQAVFFQTVSHFVQGRHGEVMSWDSDPSYPATQSRSGGDMGSVVKICAGASHFLLLLQQTPAGSTVDHQIWGWGDDRFGQLQRATPSGPSSTSTPAPILEPIAFFSVASEGFPEQVIDIAAGARHCIALTQSGAIYSWGSNDKGQLGIDLSSSLGASRAAGVNLVELDGGGLEDDDDALTITSAGCGSAHTVLGARDGTIWVAGSGELIKTWSLSLA
ncbi:unnamed protein product [Tilletia controversa]|nr:unnamed protein product [Tilletia controversa]CAD7065932.1 unnamed protein product [Tilletia caries]CAD6935885.1 unnamed protein product [Tilletia controversa]CAD6943518.1 unnamed protein product [Tilletia controversa]CAD6969980.1 unnamed protein product [Tilletia controversa]